MATSSAAPDALAIDPTNTVTLRRRYSQKLRGRYAKLNAAIREGVEERDIFGLRADALEARPIEDLPDLSYETDARKHRAFMNWLREQLAQGVLSVISRDRNLYIKRAYKSGLRHADVELRRVEFKAPGLDASVDVVFNMPVHHDAVLLLFSKNYEALEGINAEVAKQVSRTLSEGFVQGYNPRKMARALTDRVSKIGKTRAETLARTAVIEAHSTSTLNRYERVGASGVTVEAEFLATDDHRTCPICHAIEDNGRVYSIDEARTETIRYEADGDESDSLSGEYPVKPPVHPRCRCALSPVV